MFKRNKIVISMLLVAVMVTGMVVPAVAVATGSGTCNGYSYTWEVRIISSIAHSHISSSGQPTDLKTQCKAKMYYDLTNTWFTKTDSLRTGYASASSSVDNIVTINSVPVRTEIKHVWGDFYVGSTSVAKGVYAE